jgi:hypothetical protein
MPRSPLDADWLQDTLHEVSRQLRRSGEELTKCAEQLERIVTDLQSPEEAFLRPRSAAATVASDDNHLEGHPLHITVTISRNPLS